MSSRLSLGEKIQIVLLYSKSESFATVRRQWNNHFAFKPPSKSTIRSIFNKFKESGNLKERVRSGRPRSVVREETVQQVKDLVEVRPFTSIPIGARELGISQASYQHALKESGFSSFKPTKVVELSDDDFDRREEFCSTFLVKFEREPALLNKIISSDESEFKLNGVINRHNCCYWASTNQHEKLPVPDLHKRVMVWCGLTSGGLIGPYFFDQNVNARSYLAMLNDFLWPKVKRRGMIFQQDGASSHYAIVVRNWLDEKFPQRWIGRRGPIEWPARSPDLTPCDFFLWGYLKNIVYKERPATIEQLRDRIALACAQIQNEMCERACQSVVERAK